MNTTTIPNSELIAALAAIYIVIDYAGLITRYGAPITRDIIIGFALIAATVASQMATARNLRERKA